MKNNLPAHLESFNIRFANNHIAKAVRISPHHHPAQALNALGFRHLQPVIFVSGGASNMSDNDRRLVELMMHTVAQFAEEQEAIIIDGGTESGVMKLMGDLRLDYGFKFRLIGVTPMSKIAYPGFYNPDAEAELEDGHTHFILVDGDEWGSESNIIMHTIYTLCGNGQMPSVGILINGGKIALHEVYLASTTEHRLSIIVLEGSGRAADEISTAFRAGRTQQAIIQAILAGGDIQLVGTVEGPGVLKAKLIQQFAR